MHTYIFYTQYHINSFSFLTILRQRTIPLKYHQKTNCYKVEPGQNAR